MIVRILYQDQEMIICEKPVGISSESPGLPELVSAQIGQHVWPVHRLDKGTGGVFILALSQQSCRSLQMLFQQSQICKEYYAVISGSPEERSGTWSDLLWHDRIKNKSFVVTRSRCGVKTASCSWVLLETVKHEENQLSLVRVSLHTGRTHQIRVQFSFRGFPLVGDRKYGSHVHADTVSLWSSSISVPFPDREKSTVTVTSDPPPVFPWMLFSSVSL